MINSKIEGVSCQKSRGKDVYQNRLRCLFKIHTPHMFLQSHKKGGEGAIAWSFSFSISPSNEHSGLISFRMDWLDLLAVQGTVKSLLQHYNSKA